MKVTDYAGLSHFQEFCKDLDDNYVVVGGFATIMLLDKQLKGHGKATYDIDLVLLTNNSLEMSKRIKKYIKEGDYKIQIGEKDQYRYYRFIEPKKDNFAKEIELFASNKNDLKLEDSQRIIPIDPDEGLYSLSAIMLDQEYFEMIKENVDKTGVAPCTNVQATIILKMSAFYDLKNRGEDKWKKHRRDIFKLALLLTGEEKLKLKGRMLKDFNSFILHIENDLNAKDIKNFSDGLSIIKEDVIKILKEVFI